MGGTNNNKNGANSYVTALPQLASTPSASPRDTKATEGSSSPHLPPIPIAGLASTHSPGHSAASSTNTSPATGPASRRGSLSPLPSPIHAARAAGAGVTLPPLALSDNPEFFAWLRETMAVKPTAPPNTSQVGQGQAVNWDTAQVFTVSNLENLKNFVL